MATFSLGGEGDAFAIPEIGITESRHQLSHHGGDAGYIEKLTNYDTFAIEQYSYFLTRLAETKDLNGHRCSAAPCRSLEAGCLMATAMAMPIFRWCLPVDRTSG